MSKLVIDDLRILNIGGDVVYARDPHTAVFVLGKKNSWEEVWMDHDMGIDADGFELDIWPVVEFLEKADPKIKIGEVFVITSNPVGAQRMKLALDKIGYSTSVINPAPYLVGAIEW